MLSTVPYSRYDTPSFLSSTWSNAELMGQIQKALSPSAGDPEYGQFGLGYLFSGILKCLYKPIRHSNRVVRISVWLRHDHRHRFLVYPILDYFNWITNITFLDYNMYTIRYISFTLPRFKKKIECVIEWAHMY